LRFNAQYSYNSQAAGSDFLSYKGGGLDPLGSVDDRDIPFEDIGGNWDGAVGVSPDDSPVDYKLVFDGGRKWELENGLKLGAFSSLFYERDSSFDDDGFDDSKWVVNPPAANGVMTPEFKQGSPDAGAFKTGMFDLTKASQSVSLGGIATLGL